MKEYTNNQEDTRSDVNTTTKTLSSTTPGGLSTNVLARFSRVGLLDPHVLQSDLNELHSDFLDICFKEWEEWLNEYHLRSFQRKQSAPYTTTDFENH